MGRRLSGFVPVHNEDGTTSWYGPDSEIPKDVAEKIGDHAWIEDDGADPAEGDGPTPPPMGGPGSGAEAWHEYAAAVGVEVDADAKRDEIVEAIKSAGHPVE